MTDGLPCTSRVKKAIIKLSKFSFKTTPIRISKIGASTPPYHISVFPHPQSCSLYPSLARARALYFSYGGGNTAVGGGFLAIFHIDDIYILHLTCKASCHTNGDKLRCTWPCMCVLMCARSFSCMCVCVDVCMSYERGMSRLSTSTFNESCGTDGDKRHCRLQ